MPLMYSPTIAFLMPLAVAPFHHHPSASIFAAAASSLAVTSSYSSSSKSREKRQRPVPTYAGEQGKVCGKVCGCGLWMSAGENDRNASR
jgi:hypothetical protein